MYMYIVRTCIFKRTEQPVRPGPKCSRDRCICSSLFASLALLYSISLSLPPSSHLLLSPVSTFLHPLSSPPPPPPPPPSFFHPYLRSDLPNRVSLFFRLGFQLLLACGCGRLCSLCLVFCLLFYPLPEKKGKRTYSWLDVFVRILSAVLQCVAVCCSVLQCVAVCCSVLQCVAVS